MKSQVSPIAGGNKNLSASGWSSSQPLHDPFLHILSTSWAPLHPPLLSNIIFLLIAHLSLPGSNGWVAIRPTVWPGKLIKSKKKPKNGNVRRKKIGITSLWEDLEAKLLTPGQLLGYPWKVWGIKVQTSYWEGRWHQNWVRSRPTNFFTKATCKFVKNWIF